MDQPDKSTAATKKDREARLAEALRANLRRRKAQARARTDAADESPGIARPSGETA